MPFALFPRPDILVVAVVQRGGDTYTIAEWRRPGAPAFADIDAAVATSWRPAASGISRMVFGGHSFDSLHAALPPAEDGQPQVHVMGIRREGIEVTMAYTATFWRLHTVPLPAVPAAILLMAEETASASPSSLGANFYQVMIGNFVGAFRVGSEVLDLARALNPPRRDALRVHARAIGIVDEGHPRPDDLRPILVPNQAGLEALRGMAEENASADRPVHPQAIIGSVRRGKTTLNNIMLRIANEVSTDRLGTTEYGYYDSASVPFFFLASNAGRSVTRGVQAYAIETLNRTVLLLDFEGFDSEAPHAEIGEPGPSSAAGPSNAPAPTWNHANRREFDTRLYALAIAIAPTVVFNASGIVSASLTLDSIAALHGSALNRRIVPPGGRGSSFLMMVMQNHPDVGHDSRQDFGAWLDRNGRRAVFATTFGDYAVVNVPGPEIDPALEVSRMPAERLRRNGYLGQIMRAWETARENGQPVPGDLVRLIEDSTAAINATANLNSYGQDDYQTTQQIRSHAAATVAAHRAALEARRQAVDATADVSQLETAQELSAFLHTERHRAIGNFRAVPNLSDQHRAMHGNAIEQEERLMCEQVDAAADLLLATYAAASRRHLAALVDGIRNAVPPAADYVPSAANPTADPARFRQWIDERLRSFDGTARGPNDAVTAARERLASDLGSFLRLYQQQAEDFRRAERRAREQEERTRQEQERMRAERERMEGDLRAQAELRQRQMEEQARQAAEELGREREAAAAQLREVNARHMQDLRDTQAEMRSQAQQQLEETVAPLNRRIQELSADVARETARANDLQRQADELRNRGGCFASSCTAELEDGRRIGVAELRVGDHVRVARGGFEPVVGFYDADTDAEPCFLEVAFGLQDGQSGMITLTHNHMVIASNGSGPALPMQAHKLIPGTSFLMLAGSMDPVPVVSVRASDVRGAYSPATPGGTIAVSDRGPAVVASCYAKPSTFSKLAWDDAAVDAALHGASWLLRMWWAASGLAGWPLAGGAAGTGKAGPGVRALKAAAAAAFSWIGLLD